MKIIKDIKLFKTTIGDLHVWFTDERISFIEAYPLYKYEVRHDNGFPIEIAKTIIADFYGTIISEKEIELPLDAIGNIQKYRDISKDNFTINSKPEDIIYLSELVNTRV